jgi:hypothetical protein
MDARVRHRPGNIFDFFTAADLQLYAVTTATGGGGGGAGSKRNETEFSAHERETEKISEIFTPSAPVH